MHKSYNDILNGNIAKQLLIFLFPAFVGFLLQQIYGFADSIVLGRFVGKEALAGVGATSQLVGMYQNFISGIMAAITVMVAQNVGKGSYEGIHKAVKTGFYISFAIGILFTITGLLFSKSILLIINTPLEVLDNSLTYTFWYFLSITFYVVYNAGISIFRAMGDSKKPTYFIIILCVVKIGLDLLLAGVFKMGVTGTSIATFVSHFVCAMLILWIFANTSEVYAYSIKEDFGFDLTTAISTFKIGIPAGVQSMIYALTSAVVQAKINVFGTDAVAAMSTYLNVDNLFWCYVSALSAGVITIAGQNYGNGNIKRVKQTLYYGIGLFAVGSAITYVLFSQFGTNMLGLFTEDRNVIELGYSMLMIVTATYWTYAPLEIITNILKSTGDTFNSMIISIITICGSRLLFLFAYPQTEVLTPILCYPISWIFGSLVFITYFVLNKKFRTPKENRA